MKLKKKFQIIEETMLEIRLLHTILTQSLKCIEYDEGRDCEQIYLCNIIDKKLSKISNLL